jgi:hypothetical protein
MGSPSGGSTRKTSWQQGAAVPGKTGDDRWSRRIGTTVVLVAAVALLVWLLMIRGQNVIVRTVPVTEYDVLAAGPMAFPDEDIAALAPLSQVLAEAPEEIPSVQLAADFARLSGGLSDAVTGQQDTLVLFIRAHGLVENGKPMLLGSDFDPNSADLGRFAVADLLKQLASLPAGRKLIILESGPLGSVLERGQMISDFPRLLAEAVGQQDDPSIWVFHSHSTWEQPHASQRLGRSVFGHYVTAGLTGQADLDDDGLIDLNELHRYVTHHVTTFVARASGDRATQTPQLLTSLGNAPSDAAAFTLLPVSPEPAPNPGEVAAQEPEANPQPPAQPTPPADPAPPPQAAPAAKPDPVAKPDPAADPILAALNRGWRLRDRLTEPNGPDNWIPLATAPQACREFEAILLGYERLAHSGASYRQERSIAERVEESLLVLEQWIDDPTKPIPAGSTVAHRIATTRAAGWQRTEPNRSLFLATLGMQSAEAIGLRDALVATLAEPTPEKFLEWARSPVAREHTDWIEIRKATRLASEVGSTAWEATQLAVQIRLTSEQAASHVAGLPAVQHLVERADARLVEGERLLIQSRGRDASAAIAELTAAAEDYREAIRRAEQIEEAQRLADRALFVLPELAALAERAPFVRTDKLPLPNRVAELAGRVETLLDRIASGSPEAIDAAAVPVEQMLQGTRSDLAALIDEVAADPNAAGSAWTTEALLQSSLPDASERERLRDLLAQTRAEWITLEPGQMEAAVPAGPPGNWQHLQDLAALQAAWLRLGQGDRARAGGIGSPLQLAADSLNATLLSQAGRAAEEPAAATASWQAVAGFGQVLRQAYTELAQNVPQTASEASRRLAEDGSSFEASAETASPRQAARQTLALADTQLRLTTARQGRFVRSIEPTLAELASRASAWDFFVWQQQRAEQFRNIDLAEIDYWQSVAESHHRQASGIAGQPRPPSVAPPPDTVLTVVQNPPEAASDPNTWFLRLSLAARGKLPSDLWLVMDYDPRLLDVTPIQSPEIYDTNTGAGREVFRARPPSIVLREAGRPHSLVLRVRTKKASETPAELRVRFEGQSRQLAPPSRFEIEMPLPDPFELVVNEGTPEGSDLTFESQSRAVLLRPYPNHETAYRLGLVNRQKDAAKVRAEFYALAGEGRAIAWPFDESGRLLPEATPPRLILAVPEIELPARGTTAVPIPFPQPEGEAGPPPALSSDLALVVVDTATGVRWARRIIVEPLRPENYVDAEATYDPDRQQIRIQVRKRDRANLPPLGSSVQWDVGPEIDPQAAQATQGKLTGIVDRAELFAAVPSGEGKVVPVHLAIDGYQRSFLFLVRCAGRRNFAPVVATPEVRITSPAKQPRPVFKAPETASVPLEFRVDAPLEFFRERGGSVEVGVDEDSFGAIDRGVRRFFADRQVGLQLVKTTPTGGFHIAAAVSDFRVEIPTQGLRNIEVDLVSRLSTEGSDLVAGPSTDSVRIALDGEPPRLNVVGPNRIEVGKPLEVSVRAEDTLSEVAKVEAAIDVDRVGHFGMSKPMPAAFDAATGRWKVILKTEELQAGLSYTLLVRATDQVGNESRMEPLEFRAVTPPPPPRPDSGPPPLPTTRTITGIITYDGEPVRNATVELEQSGKPPARTNASGQFTFTGIPPGQYKLVAKGIARGNFRNGEREFRVTIPPSEPLAIRLELD